MHKILVLVNNKSDFKFKQACNLKDYQVTFLDLDSNLLKNNLAKIRTDILILNKEYLGNMTNLLALLVANKNMLVVYISKSLEYGQLYSIINEPNFILLEEKNISGLDDVLRYAIKTYDYLINLEKKIVRLEEEIKTNDLVRQAKLKLMHDKKLTEDEAYKYIINLAMQKRMKKSELAKLIIGGLIL